MPRLSFAEMLKTAASKLNDPNAQAAVMAGAAKVAATTSVPKNGAALLLDIITDEVNAQGRAHESPFVGKRVIQFARPPVGNVTFPVMPSTCAAVPPGASIQFPMPTQVTIALPLDIDDILSNGPEYMGHVHRILHDSDVLDWRSGRLQMESQRDITRLMHHFVARYRDPWLGEPVYTFSIPDERIEGVLEMAALRSMYSIETFRSIQTWREKAYADVLARLDYEVNNDFPYLTD